MATTKRYLAFIEPMEYLEEGKAEVMCTIRIITGDLAYKILHQKLRTDIFRYYFWGTTFEVVYIDDNMNVYKVEDVQKDTMLEFKLGVVYALTYNNITHDVLGSDGFLHNLDDSLFARHCRPVLNVMYNEIQTAYNFSMRMYTLNGAVINILFDKNMSEKSPGYKYSMQSGFISTNKDMLRNMIPKTQAEFDRKKKLTQEDIDKLFDDMNKGN